MTAGERVLALRVFNSHWTEVPEREQTAMRLAGDAGIPVPAIHHSGVHDSSLYLVTDWLPGNLVADALSSRPFRWRELGRAFGEVQARLHAIDASGKLRRDWIDWPRSAPEPIRERLQSLQLREDALLHLDYHPENVLTDGRVITAVLDWTNAHAGDPRVDLARTFTIIGLVPGLSRKFRILTAIPRRRFMRGCWEGYTELAGRPQDMAVLYAWAGHALAEDIAAKRGHPETGFTNDAIDAEVARILRHTVWWERRAGLA